MFLILSPISESVELNTLDWAWIYIWIIKLSFLNYNHSTFIDNEKEGIHTVTNGDDKKSKI